MIYWLKTASDIASAGYTYDSNCFPVDTYSSAINLGSPERKYTVKKIIGNGASISGGDYYGERKITINRRFKTDGSGTSGALTAARQAFLSKFITLSEDLYLIRDYNSSLQYIKVYPVLNAEKYKKLLISEDIEIELLCDIPFFQDATLS